MDSPCLDYDIGYRISRMNDYKAARMDPTISHRIYRRRTNCSANLRTNHFLIIYFLLLHCLLLFSKADARHNRHRGYHWKADVWSDCSSERCGEKGVQYRQVYCAYGFNELKVPKSKCSYSTEPRHERDCVQSCESEANSRRSSTKSRRNVEAVWKTGPWGDCEGPRCGEGGVQDRAVTCANADRKFTFPYSYCNTTVKPVARRSCFKICEEHRNKYTWKVEEWDECTEVDSRPRKNVEEDRCGLDIIVSGSQSRNVFCVDSMNSSITMDDYICKSFNPPPVRKRPCDLPCPINCATTHWGSWSDCSRTCGNGTQHRARAVLTKAKYGGSECPNLSSTRPCPPQPPCDPLLEAFFSHTFKFGNWTECKPMKLEIPILNEGRGRKSRKEKKENRKKLEHVDKTLIGGRSRHISCFYDGLLLGDRITVDETCLIARDCEVTEWSQWSLCSSQCGRQGNRTRTRNVNVLPTGPGAQECPPLEEVEECVDLKENCDEYTWVTGGWESCSIVPVNNASCGGGTQQRFVYCVVRNEFTLLKTSSAVAKEWAKMQPVDEELCDERYKPATWRECDVPCSSMCEVGEWSDWSDCAPEMCSEDSESTESHQTSRKRKNTILGFKIRRRKKTYSIAGDDGCPHFKEFIPCEDSWCFRWHVNSTSACQLRDGKCGEGKQLQSLVCRNKWGVDVDEKLCRKKPASPMLNMTIPCYIPCASDCVVSEWSQWTPCTNDCKRGRRETGLRSRYREILANPGPGGKACPSVGDMQQSRHCNQHRCSVYFWDVGKWGHCLVKNSVTPSPPSSGMRSSDRFMSDDGNTTSTRHEPFHFPMQNGEQVCGVGYQIRTVKCKKKGSDMVNDKLCGQDRPKRTRECTFPCPKDCVYSEWGEWNSCDRECNKLLKDGAGIPHSVHQMRHRVVIQHRAGQGVPCPLEMSQRRMCVGSEKCTSFRWHTSEWSECVKVSSTNSIYRKIAIGEELKCLGAMSRDVACHSVGAGGGTVLEEPRFCIKYIGKPPESARRCALGCREDRNFKNWMHRNYCRATLRNLESFEEIFGFSVVRHDNNSYVTMQKTARPVGEWSSCNITQSTSSTISPGLQKSSQPYCGVGIRQRALACYIEGTNIIVDNSQCQYAEFQREECEIPCPEDCEMSNWLSWGICGGTSSGSHETEVTELPCGNHRRMRHRYRVKEPHDGGRACPAIDSLTLEYESTLCHNFCNVLFWFPGSWSTCKINRNGAFSNCGEGYQTRPAECYRTDYGSGHSDVGRLQSDMRVCNIDELPYGYRNCKYPCPGECVYSEWSTWGKCEAMNSTEACSGRRKRTRAVLRQVAPETGLPKSHCDNPKKMVKFEDCELNRNCFSYSTMWTEWTSCKLPLGARCGEGIKRRKSNCISSTGLPVHKNRCIENGVPVPSSENAKCHMTCAIDCEVSPWSDWSVCAGQCNTLSQSKRTRQIVRQPSALGRACPVTMETTPCLPKSCHSWVLGDWSECHVPGGNCGTGLKVRGVKCLQSDGVAVGSSLCESHHGGLDDSFKDSDLRQDCEIPCSGECLMTDWSKWSACHLRCINESAPVAGIKSGVQTRSRVSFMLGQLITEDCPQREIEERDCDLIDGRCYFYKWKTTPLYQNGRRPVWCGRTPDGLNVSTGCDDRLKLQEELYCSQDCDSISHSYCAVNGFCECNKLHVAKRKTTGKLLACEKPPPNDDSRTVNVIDRNKKDVVVSSTKSQKISTTEEATTTGVTESSSFLDNLGLFTEAGNLKAWVYGAIAGVVVFVIFIIASIYLMCIACRRKKQPKSYGLYSTKNIKNHKSRQHKRRHNSSASNVGVGIIGGARFPPSNSVMSHTSSTSRSGYSYRDNDEILYKET